MASPQVERNVQRYARQPSVPKVKGGGLKIRHLKDEIVSQDKITDPKHLFAPSNSNNSQQNQSTFLPDGNRNRKRPREPENPPICNPFKRPRTSAANSALGDIIDKSKADGFVDNKAHRIAYWIQKERWPKECFDQDEQSRKILEQGSWIEDFNTEDWLKEQIGHMSKMSYLLAQKRSSSSLRGKQSEANSAAPSSTPPSDQNPREARSTPYQSPQYKTLLETKGVFIRKSELGIADTSKNVCRNLLEAEQTVPEHSSFQDDFFDETCEMIQDRNEAKVIQDIARLIVPSAQSLAIYGAKHLEVLIESVNEGWDNSIALTKPRPQPDYAVGFKRTAFTEDQFKKIQPFVGGFSELSFFMGTYCMYLPFLTCEVKCGAAALDVADRQNAHSTALAVRGVVELFRLVNLEKDLNRDILAFSISHDDRTVRIYGHYPVIDGKRTSFYRHHIKTFDFTSEDGKEKWTSYKFTKSVYDIWMPNHLKRICSIIDMLPPDLNFEVSLQSEPTEPELSRGLESHHLSGQSSHEGASILDEADNSRSSRIGLRDVTPATSESQRVDGRATKKPKKRERPAELHQ